MAGLPVVTSLKKTCTACPSQWDGTLDDGRVLYARYRWGYVDGDPRDAVEQLGIRQGAKGVAVAQTSKAIAGAPWCIRFLCRLPGQKANAASEGKTTTSIWC